VKTVYFMHSKTQENVQKVLLHQTKLRRGVVIVAGAVIDKLVVICLVIGSHHAANQLKTGII